jgi:LPXTG-motif cell wall-anchored protein
MQYNGSDNKATVQVGQDPQNSINFNVYTNAQWASLPGITSETDLEPVGKGTQHTSTSGTTTTITDNGDLFWEVGSANGETYHIQIRNDTTAPARYWITATGAGVTSLAPFSMAGLTVYTAQGVPVATAPTTTTAAKAPATTTTTTTPATTTTGPRTLPVTGGSDVTYIWLFGAGALLLAAGAVARRRTN